MCSGLDSLVIVCNELWIHLVAWVMDSSCCMSYGFVLLNELWIHLVAWVMDSSCCMSFGFIFWYELWAHLVAWALWTHLVAWVMDSSSGMMSYGFILLHGKWGNLLSWILWSHITWIMKYPGCKLSTLKFRLCSHMINFGCVHLRHSVWFGVYKMFTVSNPGK